MHGLLRVLEHSLDGSLLNVAISLHPFSHTDFLEVVHATSACRVLACAHNVWQCTLVTIHRVLDKYDHTLFNCGGSCTNFHDLVRFTLGDLLQEGAIFHHLEARSHFLGCVTPSAEPWRRFSSSMSATISCLILRETQEPSSGYHRLSTTHRDAKLRRAPSILSPIDETASTPKTSPHAK